MNEIVKDDLALALKRKHRKLLEEVKRARVVKRQYRQRYPARNFLGRSVEPLTKEDRLSIANGDDTFSHGVRSLLAQVIQSMDQFVETR